METQTYNISVDFEQILDLVRQMPSNEKLRLGKELEKEFKDYKLTSLLNSFQTDELSQESIDEEVEKVRAEIYAEA